MRDLAVAALGFFIGIAVMGIFCDWMLAEAQSLLKQSEALHDEALHAARQGVQHGK
jgi:hypothetical protein